jgi:hypothetical protein
MTQAGLIDYFIFFSLSLSRSHLFFGSGVGQKPSVIEIGFLVVTFFVMIHIVFHILQHYLILDGHKKPLSEEQIKEQPNFNKLILDMHFSPLKETSKNNSFLIRNHSLIKMVRLLLALLVILIGQNYPTFCIVKPLIITLGWVPLSGYWIYYQLFVGLMERKIEGAAMILSELFTSCLLIFLSIIALLKTDNTIEFFTSAVIFCLIGGVVSELIVGILGIIFEIRGKCKKKNKLK